MFINMQRIIRDRHLTDEEAAKYQTICKQVEAETDFVNRYWLNCGEDDGQIYAYLMLDGYYVNRLYSPK